MTCPPVPLGQENDPGTPGRRLGDALPGAIEVAGKVAARDKHLSHREGERDGGGGGGHGAEGRVFGVVCFDRWCPRPRVLPFIAGVLQSRQSSRQHPMK
ncbi:MAG: hypothetical protein KF791_19390 [Verrucomicrobiae bacterium]|nr:hypothetical protein [Verrucomicrobiae bacterium]